MDDIRVDRQGFVTPDPPRQPGGGGRSLWALLLVLVAIGGLGFVAHRLLQSASAGDSARGDASVAQLAERLSLLEARLDQLEKRRREPVSQTVPAPSAENDPAKIRASGASARPEYRIWPSSAQDPRPVAPAGGTGADQRIARLEKRLDSIQGDVGSDREALTAATNQLGDVVAEVGSQRTAVNQTREALDQLLARGEHDFLRFALQRGAKEQQIGPVSLLFRGADAKKRRYTVRVFVDDQWVEVKDRTLFEVVQLSVSDVNTPLKIVATQIRRDEVVGYLAVPKKTAR